jgi:hypothetical protein
MPRYVWAYGRLAPSCPGQGPPLEIHIYQVGSVIVGTTNTYQVDGSGHCNPGGTATYAYSVTEVPASTFVAGTVQTDP